MDKSRGKKQNQAIFFPPDLYPITHGLYSPSYKVHPMRNNLWVSILYTFCLTNQYKKADSLAYLKISYSCQIGAIFYRLFLSLTLLSVLSPRTTRNENTKGHCPGKMYWHWKSLVHSMSLSPPKWLPWMAPLSLIFAHGSLASFSFNNCCMWGKVRVLNQTVFGWPLSLFI